MRKYDSGRSPRRSKTSQIEDKRVKSMLDDEECISLRKQLTLQEDFSGIDMNQLNKLLSHCREYAQYSAVREEYNEALSARTLAEHIREEMTRRSKKVGSTQKEIDKQADNKSEFEDKWSRKRNDYEKETEMKLAQLKERQQKDAKTFEKHWRTTMPEKYRKPSQRLLQLKQIEKSLAVSCEIERAAEIHEQVQELTRIEAEAAQANLIRDYKSAKEKFSEKQQEETRRFFEEREHWRQVMEAEFKVEEQKVLHRDIVLEKKTKDTLLRAKSTITRPTRSSGVPKERGQKTKNLLPRPLAPNGARVKENEKARRTEIREKNQEFRKRMSDKEEAWKARQLEYAKQFDAASKAKKTTAQPLLNQIPNDEVKVVERIPEPEPPQVMEAKKEQQKEEEEYEYTYSSTGAE